MTEAASASAATEPCLITAREFKLFQSLMFRQAGVSLGPSKRSLVSGRLGQRLKLRNCADFTAYYDLVVQDAEERQSAVNLLTTNETYFFREPRHFDFLADTVLPQYLRERRGHGAGFRIWSAACSSGEEAYSSAMVAAHCLGDTGWTVVGSDLNTDVLRRAALGHYGLARTEGLPPHLLRQFCLKGTGRQAGTLLITRKLRSRMDFRQINLNAPLPELKPFDVIFLRNVMIYFSAETKAQVVRRLSDRLRPGGYLFIGHSESLNGISHGLKQIAPSIFQRPA